LDKHLDLEAPRQVPEGWPQKDCVMAWR